MPEITEQELEQLERSLLFDQIQNPGNYWQPNLAQANFVKLFGQAGISSLVKHKYCWWQAESTDNFINVWVGGNRSGKSAEMVIMAGQMLGAVDSPIFKDADGQLFPFFRHPVNRGHMWIISNTAAIRDNIVPEILRMWSPDKYEKSKDGNEYFSKFWNPKNGYTLWLKTYNQDVTEFRAKTLWATFFDEPENKPDIFQETVARHIGGGKIGFFLCPLDDAGWVYDMIIGNTNWRVGTMFAKTEINCIEHGVGGIYTHKEIQDIMAGYPADQMEARYHAAFMHLTGLVYKKFNRGVHVVRASEIPRQGTLYCAMDPHDERYPFIGYFRATPDGRMYMIREWPEVEKGFSQHAQDEIKRIFYTDMLHSSKTIEYYIAKMKQIEREIGIPAQRIMDGRFGNKRYPNSGKLVWEEYLQPTGSKESGLLFDLAAVDPTNARKHTKVKAMLDYNLPHASDYDPSMPIKAPRLFICEDCHNTQRALERYCHARGSSGSREMVEDIPGIKDPVDTIGMIADLDYSYQDPNEINLWHEVWANA